MGTFTGPDIVDDALVFAVDAGSTRSYPGSGTTVTSLIGSNTGTLTNGVSFNTNNGGTFEFDGTDDYIGVASYTGHQQSTGTMEAWINPDTTSGNHYVFGAGSSTASTYGGTRALRALNGVWTYVTYGSSGTHDWNSAGTVTTGWQHVAIGWNGTTAYFYLNGVQNSSTLSGMITPIGTSLTIGVRPWDLGADFDGEIAAVKCYSNLLTQTQIQQNYNAQKSRFGL
jgi:hypothetical protein